jgi:hypothetical protein
VLDCLCSVRLPKCVEVALGDEGCCLGIGVELLVRRRVPERCQRRQRAGERFAVLTLLAELPVVPGEQCVHPRPFRFGLVGVDGRGEPGVGTADCLVPGEAVVVDCVQHTSYVLEAHAGHLGQGADQPQPTDMALVVLRPGGADGLAVVQQPVAQVVLDGGHRELAALGKLGHPHETDLDIG